MGTAPNCARILASRSAAEGACCASPAAEARSSVAGKRCARKALPASVTESRSISRRELCFCKKLNFMFFPFLSNVWLPRDFHTPDGREQLGTHTSCQRSGHRERWDRQQIIARVRGWERADRGA